VINTNLPFILHRFQGCKQDLNLRDRDVWFLPRDETEILQGRDQDVLRLARPSTFSIVPKQRMATFKLKTIYIKQYWSHAPVLQ